MAEITIEGRAIGDGHPTYIVAEMSANHNRDFDEATEIVKAAKEAGADAVKLQTYTADTITIDCDNDHFLIKGGTLWDDKTLYDLYQEAYTPWDWHAKLQEVAKEAGLGFFSAPFDPSAVAFLEDLGVPAHKIASFEIVDLGLIRCVAETRKPVIMSTGMSTLAEIEEAVLTARSAGADQIALMRCTSAYPAPIEEANLRTIPHMKQAFDVPVGLSDHTMGPAAPVAAVALGADLIEKHFTLSRDVPGPDSAFSMEPHEFRDMVHQIRAVEKALGQVRYGPTPREQGSTVFRRSLFVVEQMKRGDEFTAENVRSIRPGYGLHTRHRREILGKRATRDIPRGTPLDWNLVGGT